MLTLKAFVRSAAFVLVFAMLASALCRPVQAAPTGKAWTSIIIGGSAALYYFGYELPIANSKAKGAAREAATFMQAPHRAADVIRRQATSPTSMTGPSASNGDAPGRFASLRQVGAAELDQTAVNAVDADREEIKMESLAELRGEVLQALVESDKHRKTRDDRSAKAPNPDDNWQNDYDALRTCWNRLVFVDPKSPQAPNKATSPKDGQKSATSLSRGADLSYVANAPTVPLMLAAQMKNRSDSGDATGNASHPQPSGGTNTCAQGLAPTQADKELRTTLNLGPDQALVYDTLVDPKNPTGQTRPAIAMIEDTQTAFDSAPSLRQQVVDERVGTHATDNSTRAAVIARLAREFIAKYPPPQPRPAGNDFSQGEAAGDSALTQLSDGYANCVAAFSPKCVSTIATAEQSMEPSLATVAACGLAKTYWLPSINAIGAQFFDTMSSVNKWRVNDAKVYDLRDYGPVPGC